jgi:4-amino-4-deoxy-L-arabinose transferase-like glycosyltransferase
MHIKKISEYIYKHQLLFLLLLYFALRLTKILSFPIFNDEALYLDWSKKMSLHLISAYLPLYDGKPPLLLWIISIFMKFIPNPLLAGRLVSIFAGAFSVIGIYKISRFLSGKKLAILASLIFTITPLFLFYDRQALHEATLAALSVWLVYLLLLFLEKFEYKYSVFAGISIGAGFFIKPSFILYIFPVLASFTYFVIKNKNRVNEIYLGTLILFSSAFTVTLPLIVQKDASLMFTRNDRYSMTFETLFKLPINVWFTNLQRLFEIYLWHLTPVVFILFILGIIYTLKSKPRTHFLVILLFLFTPTLISVALSVGILTRYLVPFATVMCIFAAYGYIHLEKYIKNISLLLLVVPLTVSIFQINDNYKYLDTLDKVTKTSDANGYLGKFTSGYGLDKALDFIIERGKKEKIYVATRIDAGNPESAVFAYFLDGPYTNVNPIYLDGRYIELPFDEDFIGYKYPLYYVARDSNLSGLNDYFDEIAKFEKPRGTDYVGIYIFNEKKARNKIDK